MTLILTATTENWTVQVCDSRISYPSNPALGILPALPRDTARKLTWYVGHGSMATIVYMGLSEVVEYPSSPLITLNEWLEQAVPPVAARALSIKQFAELLSVELHRVVEFTRVKFPATDVRLSIAIQGFTRGESRPVHLIISNFMYCGHDIPLRSAQCPERLPFAALFRQQSFEVCVVRFTTPITLTALGDERIIVQINDDALPDSLKVAQVQDNPKAARDALVKLIRKLYSAYPDGTINADCWSTIIRKGNSNAEFKRHFVDPDKQTLYPSMVGPHLAAVGFSVAQEPSGFQAALMELERGHVSQRIDWTFALAFLEWSPTINRYARILEENGVRVDSARQGFAPGLLEIIECSTYQYVSRLEQHLATLGRWGYQLIMKYARQSRQSLQAEQEIMMDRVQLLAILLVAIDPDKYPTTPPRGKYLAQDKIALWPVDDRIIALGRQFNPRFARSKDDAPEIQDDT